VSGVHLLTESDVHLYTEGEDYILTEDFAMDIYQAIGYRLKNSTDITNIVGARIYHGMRPEGEAPCINYFEVGYVPLHNGVLESPRYQISCRAEDPGDAQDLGRKVVVLFHNFQGVIDSFVVQRTTVEGKFMLPEPDTNLYHVPVDVRFVYNESTVN